MVCERFVTFVHMFSVQYVFSRYSLPLLALLVATQVHAQHGGVVVHMETGVPLRDVVVMTNTGERAKSDYRGQFQLTKPFTSLTLSHSGFVSLSLERSQMSDTLALMPQFNTLEEVTVWGLPKACRPQCQAAEEASLDHGKLLNPASIVRQNLPPARLKTHKNDSNAYFLQQAALLFGEKCLTLQRITL